MLFCAAMLFVAAFPNDSQACGSSASWRDEVFGWVHAFVGTDPAMECGENGCHYDVWTLRCTSAHALCRQVDAGTRALESQDPGVLRAAVADGTVGVDRAAGIVFVNSCDANNVVATRAFDLIVAEAIE